MGGADHEEGYEQREGEEEAEERGEEDEEALGGRGRKVGREDHHLYFEDDPLNPNPNPNPNPTCLTISLKKMICVKSSGTAAQKVVSAPPSTESPTPCSAP